MFLCAAHTCCEVLQTVHVESSAAVAGWDDAFTLGQTLHPVHHFYFEGASIVFFGLLASTLARCWKEV